MRNIVDASKLDLKSTIVNIRRVAKTVKGGRNMRFSVTVVVGDGNGYVGVGLGKSQEIPEAVRKAEEDAKKNLIYVPTVGTTVPHRNLGVFGAGRVLIMPAAQGTGVIAGSSVRTVLEAAGIKDVRAKSIGSNNTGNMAYATLEGLKGMMTVEKVAKLRGKTKEEIRFYMLHQANKRIVASVSKHMNEPLEKYPMNIENLGNTSSASIPLLLDEWNKKGRLNSGDWIILSGFGGGLTYGASLLQW